ncbi:MAG: UPF0182 family protein [Myxococcales bacterium]|nr:UPF0182 family protein [Myxococcales bacterium]
MPKIARYPKRGLVIAILIAVAVLGVVLPTLGSLYVDMLWFRALHFSDTFFTIFGTKVLIGLSVGVLIAALFYGNARLAVRFSRDLYPLYVRDPRGLVQVDLGRIVTKIIWPATLFAGLLSGLAASAHWDTWLMALHGTRFQKADPILGYDIGYYVFQLPLREFGSGMALGVLVFLGVVAGVIYLGRGALMLQTGLRITSAARVHLSLLLAAIALVLAYETHLAIVNLLFSHSGPVVGASYSDIYARMPALRVKMIVSILGAVLLILNAAKERLSLVALALGLYLAVDILGVRVYPAVVQKFSVVPNEFDKESRFIDYNIQATREAFNLDKVSARVLSAESVLTHKDIENNRDTIENIRVWDHGPLLDTFAQIQEIRTYYDFASVDNDRYVLDGKLRQTMLSPRELSSDSLPNRTWINERFTFTHGYGLTLGPVNQATPEGLPVLFVKDIPPESSKPSLKVTEPAIYYGELSNDYVFVRTRNPEFHHPTDDGSVFTSYKGGGGIPLDSLVTQLSLALHFGSIKILLSDDVRPGSRALLFRNIKERVQKVAPFLAYDHDPYLVIRADGTLVWIMDGYTHTTHYPYAEAASAGLNYIRNAVKTVINAYDGSVTFYVVDDRDPILRTWRKILPHMFKPLRAMPQDIRTHLRYPLDMFNLQTEMFSVYHMTSAELVYNREDQWEIPALTQGESRKDLEPYYTVMKLPGEQSPEFILMLPFTPKRKDNLAAWLVARSDGQHLGELVVYAFPKDRLVFGPQQIANRINQDAEISRQISLWDQRGSQAILGTLLVIPIEESLIYVQPLYLRSQGGKIPELKRVVVAYENGIAMERTLDEALSRLFGAEENPKDTGGVVSAHAPETRDLPAQATSRQPKASSEASGSTDELRARAWSHYQQAVDAQRNGDWARYGEELQALGEVLKQMQ